ncbi:hypothetical protein [Brevibacillus dissolubilis]|uniref:hypothetical protein n=1 Tax=Brevibacillus dissolubilis TaxID=1844116 RepID=UPI0021000A4B|nr:hypothetical protein [Brevibacillus dissolubilis]
MKMTAKKTAFILLAVSMLQLSGVSAAFAKNYLKEGETLSQGQSLVSNDGRFTLIMQADGNLVLYKAGTGLWDTNTDNKSQFLYYDPFLNREFYAHPEKLIIMNGTLRVTDNVAPVYFWYEDTKSWSNSHYGGVLPEGLKGDTLVVQDDGNLVFYDNKFVPAKPVWASNTNWY